ncbi:basic membrane lipoprotein, partial [Pseudomonas syringae pv. pisi str. 1704B]
HGTGHHRDLSEFAPKATVCSSLWVWDRFLGPELKKIIAGNWTPPANGALLSMQQGGTDVRANTTRAFPVGAGGPGQAYELVGHKWFCSAP